MIGGKMPMIPDLSMGMIDVRDVARLHVAALTAENAAGKRFIASGAEPVSMFALAGILRDAGYREGAHPSKRRPPC